LQLNKPAGAWQRAPGNGSLHYWRRLVSIVFYRIVAKRRSLISFAVVASWRDASPPGSLPTRHSARLTSQSA